MVRCDGSIPRLPYTKHTRAGGGTVYTLDLKSNAIRIAGSNPASPIFY